MTALPWALPIVVRIVASPDSLSPPYYACLPSSVFASDVIRDGAACIAGHGASYPVRATFPLRGSPAPVPPWATLGQLACLAGGGGGGAPVLQLAIISPSQSPAPAQFPHGAQFLTHSLRQALSLRTGAQLAGASAGGVDVRARYAALLRACDAGEGTAASVCAQLAAATAASTTRADGGGHGRGCVPVRVLLATALAEELGVPGWAGVPFSADGAGVALLQPVVPSATPVRLGHVLRLALGELGAESARRLTCSVAGVACATVCALLSSRPGDDDGDVVAGAGEKLAQASLQALHRELAGPDGWMWVVVTDSR